MWGKGGEKTSCVFTWREIKAARQESRTINQTTL